MNRKIISVAVITAVVVGAASFYGGMKYGQSKASKTASSNRQQFAGAVGAGAGNTNRRTGGTFGPNSAGFISGSIISKDDKSITVQSRDARLPDGQGGSKIVFLGSSTSISKTTNGSISDLAVGEPVVVNGTANSDGSVTAQNIQIRPAMPQENPQPGNNK
jgi:hypothetical protein